MKAFLLLADGFETIEALAPVDILRRCGVDIRSVSITSNHTVISSHKIEVKSDLLLAGSDIYDGDMLILPGGYPGYENLSKSAEVGRLLKGYFEAGKYVAAICGAPVVLAKYGVAKGFKLTCHSSVVGRMGDYDYVGGNVVCDRNVITGSGAGHSLEFGFALAGVLTGEATINKVKAGMEL